MCVLAEYENNIYISQQKQDKGQPRRERNPEAERKGSERYHKLASEEEIYEKNSRSTDEI